MTVDIPGILRHAESGDLVHQSCVEVEELASYDHVEAVTVTGGQCTICDEPLVSPDEEDDVIIDEEDDEEGT